MMAVRVLFVIFLNEATPPSSCCVSAPGWCGNGCHGTIALPLRGYCLLVVADWPLHGGQRRYCLSSIYCSYARLMCINYYLVTPTPFLTLFSPTNYPLFTDLSYDRLMRSYNCHMVSDFLAPICCCPCCRSCPPPPTPTPSLYWVSFPLHRQSTDSKLYIGMYINF